MSVRDQLLRDGFAATGAVLSSNDCSRYADIAAEHYARLDDRERAARRSPGSFIDLWQDVRFADLIAWQTPRDVITALDIGAPTYSNGYIVLKPAQSPPTFWHQDWWGWNDDASYTPFIHQVAALVYLVDTTTKNGCLRVIPGSHRKRHPLHRDVTEDEVRSFRRYDDPSVPELQHANGEIDVPARAGEIVLIDARLLHAAHANITAFHRPAFLLWFALDHSKWSPELRSRLPNVRVPQTWPDDARKAIEPLLPPLSGVEQRAPVLYGLNPDQRLR
jgi:ectoine hydroxylase-related dioxygenase (phytanoyl-CoA dioxygenase family)